MSSRPTTLCCEAFSDVLCLDGLVLLVLNTCRAIDETYISMEEETFFLNTAFGFSHLINMLQGYDWP